MMPRYTSRVCVGAAWSLAIAPWGLAELPETGVEVTQLDWVDEAVQEFMSDNGIRGGLVGIMKDGRTIYQRGFGWMDEDESVKIPENALVRLASCTKPITAAAIRRLEREGKLALSDFVFDLPENQPTGGILTITPYPELGDERLADVTVQQCLSHRGGWDRNTEPDYAQRPCETADDMGIESPPGVDNTLAWALGQPLQFDPDHHAEYSNFGYCVLGEVIETLSGRNVLDYHRRQVLTANMWVPATDLILGETFAEAQPDREAWYDANGGSSTCVFDRDGKEACQEDNRVDTPYGSWDHAAYEGFGGMVASAATMLELAERYYLQGLDPDIGTPLSGRVNGAHGGTISGTSTLVVQRSDGVNVFLFFNNVDGRDDYHFANDFYKDELKDNLTRQSDWPTVDVAGFWVHPDDGTTDSPYGSYDAPFAGVEAALSYVVDGSKVNFKPGTSDWTGTIRTKVLLRAPEGAAGIGVRP